MAPYRNRIDRSIIPLIREIIIRLIFCKLPSPRQTSIEFAISLLVMQYSKMTLRMCFTIASKLFAPKMLKLSIILIIYMNRKSRKGKISEVRKQVVESKRGPKQQEQLGLDIRGIDNQIMNPEEAGEQIEVKRQDIEPCYRLCVGNGKNVIHPTHRLKLLWWMIQRAEFWRYSRQASALACYYFDVFAERVGNIEINDLQITGIVCLIVAAKIEQRIYPKIDTQLFPARKIESLEKKFYLALGFRLLPVTYVWYIDRLISQWDSFANSAEETKGMIYYRQDKQAYLKMSQIYSRMDGIAVAKSLIPYDYEAISLNIFFLSTNPIFNDRNQSNFEEQILQQYDCSSFLKIFKKFLFKSEISNLLDSKIGTFLAPFMMYKGPEKVPGFKCKNFAEYVQTQTIDIEIRTIALNFIRQKS